MLVFSCPKIFCSIVGLLTSYTLPPSHFRNGIYGRAFCTTQWHRPCRILTGFPCSSQLPGPQYRFQNIYLKIKIALANTNTTDFLAPTFVPHKWYSYQMCPSISIMADILAHTLGKDVFPALCTQPSQFPSDRITPRIQSSCIYSNGQSTGLSPVFLITAPAEKGSHSG